MHTREKPSRTIESLLDEWKDPDERVNVLNNEVEVDLSAMHDGGTSTMGVIRLKKDLEVPATREGLKALSQWANIPKSFFDRIPARLKEDLINTLLKDKQGERIVLLDKDDAFKSLVIRELREPKSIVLEPRQFVAVGAKTLKPSAEVVQFFCEPDEIRLDAIVPARAKKGIGGDAKVGDITRGGVRLWQDRAHGLAPQANPYFYRLVCTNGMETVDNSLKLEGRGSTLDEVLRDFEEIAQRAFAHVEDNIAAFYDLRSQRVENREQTIRRLAREQRLPDRVVGRLLDESRDESYPDDGEFTMFDVANVFTNLAVDPTTRDSTARALEQAGGNIVVEHAARCRHCLARLN